MKLIKVYQSGKTSYEQGGINLTYNNDEIVAAIDVSELTQEEIEAITPKVIADMIK